ncbi:sensor histidine kinase [Amycolatopsis sp.]|uniref:sensor histidine kinase n=1 Tax=Amycolatopsis sp. TaxID=37632 RepID=UPI002E007EAC|nr:histidine kinase [Amycolatopsis sp.]
MRAELARSATMPTDALTRQPSHLIERGLLYAVALVSVPFTGYYPGGDPVWPLMYAIFLVCVAGAVAYSLPSAPRWVFLAGLLTVVTVSAVSSAVGFSYFTIIIYCEAAFTIGFRLTLRQSGAILSASVAVVMVAAALGDRNWPRAFGVSGAFVSIWLSGATRRQYRQRTEQAEVLVTETRRAADADHRAAALAERARIAREIHDIQAHSLSALSLQLEAAGALLQNPSLPAGDPVLAKIAGCVDRASRLAREGLAETSRAVQALREDAVSLPELLASLVDGHDRVTVDVRGEHRKLAPGPGLTLYRAIQEGLTNARKHAPAAPVTIELDYAADAVTATVTNAAIPDNAARPLTSTGSGYGLTGIRERAELAGGSLTAGPDGDGWRVSVRIPS